MRSGRGRGCDTRAMETTLYERVGRDWFFALVERFYVGVAADPLLRPMYPDDLEPGKEHLALFLVQYWGGPPEYSQLRGHPRLRRRHMEFPIDDTARLAWFRHMTEAVRAGDLSPSDETEVLTYFESASRSLVNQL